MNFANITDGSQTWRVYDEGTGPAIVLFHGFPDSPEDMHSLAMKLQQRGYRTIVPYLRGYHADTIVADRPYDARHIGQDGLGLLDALGLQNAIVIGHDWGASVAYGMAAFAPERVKALVTIAIPHPVAIKPSAKGLLALRHFVHFKLPFAEARTRFSNFSYMSTLIQRFEPTSSKTERMSRLVSIQQRFADPQVLASVINYYRDFSAKLDKEFFVKQSMPSLLIAGSMEVGILGGLATYHRSCEAFSPKGELLIVPDTMHSPHIHNEAMVLERLDTFLTELS